MHCPLVLALALLVSACGQVSSQGSDGELGKKTYTTYCQACHGADGKLRLNEAPDLSYSKMSMDERIANITDGGSMMPAFKEVLTEEEIKAVASYLEELKISVD